MSTPGFTLMRIFRMVLDPSNNAPIVILQDPEGGALLPIWIGIFEAHAIAMKLEQIQAARPMTHDLLKGVLDSLGAALERVEVVDLVDNTYIARLQLRTGDTTYKVDSRPSDAIAVALRADCPIFVADHVLEASKIDPANFKLDADKEEGAEGDEDEWTRMLKNYNPPGGREKIN